MKTYRYIIQGTVQGVAFRYYTMKYARELSIDGWVKNLFNGDVEVLARGSPENIERFEAFLRSGPPSAIVNRVIKEESGANEIFTDFEITF